jgi:hypothetical protein
VPIEEFQDLDRHLAAVVKTVAELGRRKPAFGGMRGDIDGDLRHLLHHRTQKEMVLRNFLDVATTRRHAHEAPHKGFIDVHGIGDIAHPWWPIGFTGEARVDQRPDPLLLLREFHLVARAAHPRSVQRDVSGLRELPDGGQENRGGQEWFLALAQLLEADAREIRPPGMEGVQRPADVRPQPLPGLRRNGSTPCFGRQRDERKV